MMDSLIVVSRFWYRPSLGTLLIRVATGLIFFHHGWMKLQNVAGAVGFLGVLGVPAWLAYLVIAVEVVGGIMLVFGVATRAAAVATGIVALVAFLIAVVPQRGIAGGELELLLSAVSFGIALSGAGGYRLVHIFEHDRENARRDEATI
jgi:uncharacterized membrane protein YphA (DoxX/SURF4 family)